MQVVQSKWLYIIFSFSIRIEIRGVETEFTKEKPSQKEILWAKVTAHTMRSRGIRFDTQNMPWA